MTIHVRDDAELTRDELKKLIDIKKQQLKEMEKFGKNSNYIQELSNLALLQVEIGNYDEAEKNFFTCLKHFEKQLDRPGQAAVYGLLGTLYYKKEEFQNAINFYIKAHEIYKGFNQLDEKIACLTGIGSSYLKLNQLDEASDYFFQCGELCFENNDILSFLDCLGNLITIYELKDDWSVVFDLYRKSLDAFKKINDSKGIVVTNYNLGIIEKRNNNLMKALKYFKDGTHQALISNYTELILKGLTYLGEIYYYLGKLNDAKEQYIKALNIAENVKSKNSIIQIRILLNSLGLSDYDIKKELENYQQQTNSD